MQGTAALKTVCESVDVPVMAIGDGTSKTSTRSPRLAQPGWRRLVLPRVHGHPGGLARLVRDLRGAFSKAGVLPHDR